MLVNSYLLKIKPKYLSACIGLYNCFNFKIQNQNKIFIFLLKVRDSFIQKLTGTIIL
jgi:hypothetical protein